MTDREKAIVMAYTGISMLVGDKFSIFHEYIEKICGRPIWTHELAEKEVCNEIKEKSKPDFIALCRETTEAEPIRHGEWIPHKVPPHDLKYGFVCSECDEWSPIHSKFCRNCGAKMDGKEQGK